MLRFAKTPDYETPADVAGTPPSTSDNTYEITVQAMDSTGKIAHERSDGRGHQRRRRWHGDPLGAAAPGRRCLHREPDRPRRTPGATNPSWQWAKSRSKNGSYTDIDNAEAATYTPTDASGKSDVGYYLRATVSYTDPEGSGKSAMMKSDYTVHGYQGQQQAAPEFADDQGPHHGW